MKSFGARRWVLAGTAPLPPIIEVTRVKLLFSVPQGMGEPERQNGHFSDKNRTTAV
jgi:hypothetical protein